MTGGGDVRAAPASDGRRQRGPPLLKGSGIRNSQVHDFHRKFLCLHRAHSESSPRCLLAAPRRKTRAPDALWQPQGHARTRGGGRRISRRSPRACEARSGEGGDVAHRCDELMALLKDWPGGCARSKAQATESTLPFCCTSAAFEHACSNLRPTRGGCPPERDCLPRLGAILGTPARSWTRFGAADAGAVQARVEAKDARDPRRAIVSCSASRAARTSSRRGLCLLHLGQLRCRSACSGGRMSRSAST